MPTKRIPKEFAFSPRIRRTNLQNSGAKGRNAYIAKMYAEVTIHRHFRDMFFASIGKCLIVTISI